MAQTIGHVMDNLVVLEHHLWLSIMEVKDADKTALLDSPVSPSGLFGSTVDHIAERFTMAQKTSKAMRHFLPASFSAASSRPKLLTNSAACQAGFRTCPVPAKGGTRGEAVLPSS